MRLDLLTALSVNGLITGGRGRHSHDLIDLLHTPREVMERKYEIRRRYDAGLVGTGTVLADDPTLASHVAPGARGGARITLDPRGRIPRKARFFDGSVRTLVGVGAETPRDFVDFLLERGVEPVLAPPATKTTESGRIDLPSFLAALEERGIASIYCEGGGTLSRGLLEAGLISRLILLVIPVVLEAGSVNLFEESGAPARLRLEGCDRQGEYVWLEYAVDRAVGNGVG